MRAALLVVVACLALCAPCARAADADDKKTEDKVGTVIGIDLGTTCVSAIAGVGCHALPGLARSSDSWSSAGHARLRSPPLRHEVVREV